MNRKTMMTLLVLVTAMLAVGAYAQDAEPETNGGSGQGAMVMGFLDEDGDGFNDLAPDADGDGIPNGLDEDYVPAGAGEMKRWGQDEEFGGSFGAEAQGNLWRHEVHSEFGTTDGMGPVEGTAFGPGDGEGVPEPDPAGELTQQRGER